MSKVMDNFEMALIPTTSSFIQDKYHQLLRLKMQKGTLWSDHGPMIGHLLPLISHCTYLQHLSTSTIGQDDITDPAYNQTREERRYDAPAAFIASTRDALGRWFLSREF
jgi:hypothetical protein